MRCVHVCEDVGVCVCVCVRVCFYRKPRTRTNASTSNRGQHRNRGLSSIREMVQTNANACGYTCKKTQKSNVAGVSPRLASDISHTRRGCPRLASAISHRPWSSFWRYNFIWFLMSTFDGIYKYVCVCVCVCMCVIVCVCGGGGGVWALDIHVRGWLEGGDCIVHNP